MAVGGNQNLRTVITPPGGCPGGVFKYALFVFENAGLAEELRICDRAVALFGSLPFAKAAVVQRATSPAEAAHQIDEFRARNCGSGFNAALMNLSGIQERAPLELLLGSEALGDPRTLFLASLRAIQGPIYQLAREKVDREGERVFEGAMPPPGSCLDTYSPNTREEVAARAARLLVAYLQDEEERTSRRSSATVVLGLTHAGRLMRETPNLYCGRRADQSWGRKRDSGFFRPVSGRFSAQ
jgi:hypothetical protein